MRWIEEHCRIPEGKDVGKPVRLRPFQRKIVLDIYNTPTRMAIISFGRKNAKTALASFLLLLHLVGPEAKPNSQLYSAGQTRDQAAQLYGYAAKCVRLSPTLCDYVYIRDSKKQLTVGEIGTQYTALSADASSQYGKSPVFAVHDELGQVRGPTSELFDAIETGCGAHESPLSIVISTQAPDDNDLLSRLIDDALAANDPTVKVFLYTAPETLDPFSEEALKAANPAYGDFLNPTETRRTAEMARRMPTRENSYRNLILNQRVNAFDPFVSRTVWQLGNGAVDDTVFRRRQVFAGLDLSARTDLTALVLVAEDEKGVIHARAEFFAPLIGLEDRAHRDRMPYEVWAREGLITLTPGTSVGYDFVAARLAEIAADCDLVGVAYDRWRIDIVKKELAALGIDVPLVEFGQGYKDMGPALDVAEEIFANGVLRHGGHPVLRMCASNAIVTKNPAGDRKLDKSKAKARIDGLVALVMALGIRARTVPEESLDGFIKGAIA